MYIKVRVVAGAKQEAVRKKTADTYLLSVREEAKQNQANRRVVALMAGVFAVPVGKVRLVSGHHSPNKIISVDVEI